MGAVVEVTPGKLVVVLATATERLRRRRQGAERDDNCGGAREAAVCAKAKSPQRDDVVELSTAGECSALRLTLICEILGVYARDEGRRISAVVDRRALELLAAHERVEVVFLRGVLRGGGGVVLHC